jgi:hypothetical protein
MNDVTVVEFFRGLTVGQVENAILYFAAGYAISAIVVLAFATWLIRRLL